MVLDLGLLPRHFLASLCQLSLLPGQFGSELIVARRVAEILVGDLRLPRPRLCLDFELRLHSNVLLVGEQHLHWRRIEG